MLYRHAIGYVLRDKRLRLQLSLRDIADDAPMSLSFLSEVERGQKEVSSEILAKLAAALGTTVGELIAAASIVLLDWESQEETRAIANAGLVSIDLI